MSYQVLARKWRPRFFDEMVGQEHVLRALINALNEGRLHHAYLFTGTRGVGKTTIARILAKCLNCEEGVSARPCGECSSCREIAEGRFVDLIEVDAASRTRVEDTRELLDNVQYAPTRGRYKVYLIDEVHMLSTHSFNALLKTLEEPPEHVKFLLATTDPQKLPVTILSRCLQFSLKNMTPERIVGYLAKVLDAETVPYDEAALWALGRAAQGSMRDALSLTDQAIAFGEGEVHESQVNSMLGSMDRGRLFRLAEVMAKADAAAILAETASMAEHSPDYDEILQGLLHIWHRASLAQVVPDAIENAEGDREAILQLSMAMPAEDLQLCYQVALQGRKDLAMAPDPRQGFEMILLRMLAFRPAPETVPELDLESALEKKKPLTPAVKASAEDSRAPGQTPAPPLETEPSSDATETRTTEAESSVAEITDVQVDVQSEVSADASVDASTQAPSGLGDVLEESPPPVVPGDQGINHQDSPDGGSHLPLSATSSTDFQGVESSAKEFSEAVAQDARPRSDTALADLMDAPQADAGDSSPTPLPVAAAADEQSAAPAEQPGATEELPDLAPHTWYLWVERLRLAGLTMAIARNSALISVSQDDQGRPLLEFDVDPAQGALYNDTQRQRIQDAMDDIIPGASLQMTLTATRGETPEQRRQRLKADALYSARQAIDSDPLVDQIVSELGGQVIEDTVRPNT